MPPPSLLFFLKIFHGLRIMLTSLSGQVIRHFMMTCLIKHVLLYCTVETRSENALNLLTYVELSFTELSVFAFHQICMGFLFFL